jgi:ADP-ribose pyrophosphatase
LRRYHVEFPDGLAADYTMLEGPAAAVVVPVFEDGTTVLVRQWRGPWGTSSWEAPAGTIADGEEPLACARRELIEEAGIEAAGWTPLGVARSSAISTVRFHIFLAQDLKRVPRAPEATEVDMVVRELPLRDALDAALSGGIVHAGSIAAICRACRELALI